jgi:hypothetical protein
MIISNLCLTYACLCFKTLFDQLYWLEMYVDLRHFLNASSDLINYLRDHP